VSQSEPRRRRLSADVADHYRRRQSRFGVAAARVIRSAERAASFPRWAALRAKRLARCDQRAPSKISCYEQRRETCDASFGRAAFGLWLDKQRRRARSRWRTGRRQHRRIGWSCWNRGHGWQCRHTRGMCHPSRLHRPIETGMRSGRQLCGRGRCAGFERVPGLTRMRERRGVLQLRLRELSRRVRGLFRYGWHLRPVHFLSRGMRSLRSNVLRKLLRTGRWQLRAVVPGSCNR
jgi:hypothetical protein